MLTSTMRSATVLMTAALVASVGIGPARADEGRSPVVLGAASAGLPQAFDGPRAPAQLYPFGAAPAPRLVLFPCMQVTRPADVPPPKPTKGLGLAFDW